MKFNVLSLALLTVFALNVKAEDAKPVVTPAAPQEVKIGAANSTAPADYTIDAPGKDDLTIVKPSENIPAKPTEGMFTKASKAVSDAYNAVTTKVSAAATSVKENAEKAVTAVNTYANNVAVNGVSMVKTHKIETAVVVAAVSAYVGALNGVFGKKVEKFTNKYKQLVIGATAALSAVLVYKLATTTPAVVEKAAEIVKVVAQKVADTATQAAANVATTK